MGVAGRVVGDELDDVVSALDRLPAEFADGLDDSADAEARFSAVVLGRVVPRNTDEPAGLGRGVEVTQCVARRRRELGDCAIVVEVGSLIFKLEFNGDMSFV